MRFVDRVPTSTERARAATWWETLPSDRPYERADLHLPFDDTLATTVAAAADVALRTAVATIIMGLTLPYLLDKRTPERERKAIEFYGARARESNDPAFHFPTPEPHAVDATERPPRDFEPGDAVIRELSFRSRFEPLSDSGNRTFLGSNEVAHATWWTVRGARRPTICFFHGFGISSPRFYALLFDLTRLYREGFDIVLLTHPFHARRAPTSRSFGEAYVTRGVGRFVSAVSQSVHDERVFVRYLLDECGVPSVGVAGLSLGGLATSLVASTESRLAFAIPIAAAVSPVDIGLAWYPTSVLLPKLDQFAGLRVEEIRAALAPYSPQHYPPAIARERLMIIGAVGDRLACPAPIALLHEHWGRPKIHWDPGNHIIPLRRRAMVDAILEHVRATT